MLNTLKSGLKIINKSTKSRLIYKRAYILKIGKKLILYSYVNLEYELIYLVYSVKMVIVRSQEHTKYSVAHLKSLKYIWSPNLSLG